MKIAVIGSRDFKDFKLVCKVMEEYRTVITVLVSGGAAGADSLGARWARKAGITTEIHEPDHRRYKHAYHHRNRLIAESADLIVAFWKNGSSGTRYTIEYAERLGKPVRVIKV